MSVHEKETASTLQGRLLILMRHAKSDWGDDSLCDHDRPLNKRGRRDAPAMAQWLKSLGAVPDTILSSTAERTRQTVDRMLPEWSSEPVICHSEDLYLAHLEEILRCIQSAASDAKRLMVVAHNPGIAYLASSLADTSFDMPTAAIAIFRVKVADWGELSSASDVELVETMKPKSL